MKKAGLLFVSLIVAFAFIGCATMDTNTVQMDLSSATDAVYLSEYFGIAPFSGEVDAQAFDAAMLKVVGKDVVDENNFQVLKSIVDATALTELAATYTEEKAVARLALVGINSITGDTARYLACALDAHVVSPAAAMRLSSNNVLDSDIATYLLMNVANANGAGRNYLGNISDSDILRRISNAFDGYTLFSDNNLDAIGARAVQDKASTGYNLKIDSSEARFLPSLTLQYGHSDETHLKQLVVLLNSEGIDAKLQIEPKVSIYEYLLDWGPVPAPSPFYMVLQFSEDLYLAYAVEYDAKFEFETVEDLQAFDSIINTYSKKNDANQAPDSTVKLIRGAWWQPLYSATFNPDADAYKEIVDCVLAENGYTIHPFSLPQTKDVLVDKLESLSGLEVQEIPLYVNNAFHRYLTGEDYQ